MIVLDTNVISEALRPAPDPAVMAWLTELSGEVAITSVALAELLAGVQRLADGRRRRALAQGIDAIQGIYRRRGAILAFDEAAAEQYAIVTATRDAAGAPISTHDAQIAAICRARGAICATRNTKDFDGTGIALINPWSLAADESS